MTTERRQFIRGTDPEYTTEFQGLEGEITVDLNLKTVRVHDGVTKGGTPLATKADINNIDLSGYQPKLSEEQMTAINDVIDNETVDKADIAYNNMQYVSYASGSLSIETGDWVSSSTYANFPYQATITDYNVPNTMSLQHNLLFPIATFLPQYTEVLDGTIAPVVNFIGNKQFVFYAKKVPSQALSVNVQLILMINQGQ